MESTCTPSKMPPFLDSSSSSSLSDSLLIPGLPDDVASRILSIIPCAHHAPLKLTCKSWHKFLSSQTIIPLRRNLGRASHFICLFPGDPSAVSPVLFDVHSLAWRPLRPMPRNPDACARSSFGAVFLFPHLYVIGGSVSGMSSSPMDRSRPSSSVFRFDFVTESWEPISPMLSPRESVVCTAVAGEIVAAGGWWRDTASGEEGSRMRMVERYDVARDKWEALGELPEHRAGCIGFVVKEREFWVMGGSGGFPDPVDVYCKDAVVMDLVKRKWRTVGNMWGDDDSVRTGRIAVVGNEESSGLPGVFMIHENEILRYDMSSNSWLSETIVPIKVPKNAAAFSFVALGEEVLVMTLVKPYDSMDNWRFRAVKRIQTLHIQIYHTRMKTWRSLQTKPPFTYGLNFRATVMCTIQL